jgi:hypothetical protein
MKGISTYYPGKIQKPVTVNLTEVGWRIMDATTARTARSRSDLVEHLLRRHAAALRFDDLEAAKTSEPLVKAGRKKRRAA